jgi:peroxiredoxin Q/BCP
MSTVTTLEVGAPAPEFNLPASTGETINLADLRGRPVVLYFYPKDDTPGCTTEACSFRDNLAVVQGQGAVLLGVSPDSVASHQKFARKHGLEFPLLADTDKTVSQAYGVWVEKNMYGRKYFGVERSTFLIGPDGRLERIWRKVSPKGHVAQVLAALESAAG